MNKTIFKEKKLIKTKKELLLLQLYIEASRRYFSNTKAVLENYNLSDKDKVLAIKSILNEFESKVLS